MTIRSFSGFFIIELLAFLLASALVQAQQPAEIEKATGIDSGVVLLLDGSVQSAEAWAKEGRWLVHLMASDPQVIPKAREALARKELGGRIHLSALSRDGSLPHPDRFINLVVGDLHQLPQRPILRQEIERVLARRGATWLRENGAWQAKAVHHDAKIDGWFSRWYDATGNSVSRDRAVGFPVAVQWQHGPAMEDGGPDQYLTILAAKDRERSPKPSGGNSVISAIQIIELREYDNSNQKKGGI